MTLPRLNSLNNNFSSFFGKNLIHTSAILYSDPKINLELNKVILRSEEILEEERLSNSQLVKYNDKIEQEKEEDLQELNNSSYQESFPWFYNEDGIIDYNKSIRLFDSIKLISKFLESKYIMDRTEISSAKIQEFINIFKDKEEVTILELFNHVVKTCKNDPDFFKTKIDDIVQNNPEIVENLANIKYHYNLNVPLNISTSFQFDPFKAMDFVSYSFMLRSYQKMVYDTTPPFTNAKDFYRHNRHKHLGLIVFAVIGAPALVLFSRHMSASQYGTSNVELSINQPTNSLDAGQAPIMEVGDVGVTKEGSLNQMINNSTFFIFLKNLNNKIPLWVKFGIKFIFLIIIILKLLGINLIDFFSTIYYIKMYFLISASLVIIYFLLCLYLLHKFYNNPNLNIPEILPDFLIDWLDYLKSLSSSKELLNYTKKIYYIELSI